MTFTIRLAHDRTGQELTGFYAVAHEGGEALWTYPTRALLEQAIAEVPGVVWEEPEPGEDPEIQMVGHAAP